MTKYTERVLNEAYQVQVSGGSLKAYARAKGLNTSRLYTKLTAWKRGRGIGKKGSEE